MTRKKTETTYKIEYRTQQIKKEETSIIRVFIIDLFYLFFFFCYLILICTLCSQPSGGEGPSRAEAVLRSDARRRMS